MTNINVENIVASTQIAGELDIERLSKDLPDSKYHPEEFPGLILHFEDPKTAALVFSSGKIICTGAKNMDEVNDTVKSMTKKIKDAGASTMKKPQVKMQNIVASADLKKDLHLSSIAKSLMLENVEYEPEQFPGLVYRLDNLGVVLLLFSSGKLVCTGAKTLEDVSNAVDTVKEKLSSLGIL